MVQENTKPHKVMLVDDSETDLFINETMIKYAQFSEDILSFNSASKALSYLQKIKASDDTMIPDVIFLDINMPLINGFEFIREYQKLPEYIKERSNIVLLSSTFNTNDMKRSQQTDEIVGLIAKPLTLDSLQELVKLEI